jgi:hypothetical protein|tara:strand:- start:577 stop:756 length:180 start_codon:yes stop_codon:yes gene_type:complete
MIDCSIKKCEKEGTNRVFCIFLCDNHHHIIYNMNDNVVTVPQMKAIIDERLKEEQEEIE